MIYRKFQNEKISAMALGTMRLPTVGGDANKIDKEHALRMFDRAHELGVNYFDTAWGYHGGNSELITGKALERYPRDSFFLATKFPGYDVSNFGKVEKIFAEQLKKCRVDYFDFYLFHNVCETNISQYLDDAKYGTYSFLMEQRRTGRIRHLGFSCHGSIDTLNRFLDAYGDDMEFCQLQLNYLDWEFQQGREKVEILKKWGIPVFVMEPIRGGKLASLPKEHEAALKALRPDESLVGWCFRFLQSHSEIITTLTGASSLEQVEQNAEIFSQNKPLDEKEAKALAKIASEMTSVVSVPCTACRYCTGYCPIGLDIPTLLSLYNEQKFSGGGFLAPMRVASMPESKRPSACIACRSCEAVCPQGIKISEALAELNRSL